MQRKSLKLYLLYFSFILILTGSSSVAGQDNQFRINYTVEVKDTAAQLFHVTANIKNINQDRLDLSLPTWTPGWYTVENYAKNILRFKITDEKGALLPHTMKRKQTWSVDTKGRNQIKAEFDYRADTLALNQAKITKDFAFFTGVQLFLLAEGHRESPSTVRFIIPQGWKIISALNETIDPLTFSAPDYDTLVDAPTQLGRYDLWRFEVEGKPHYFVSTPAAAFSSDKAQKFVSMLAKVFAAQSAIFGGLPYDKYVCFYFFAQPESNAGGALEHLNSFVSFAPPGHIAQPENLIGTASHEFFHLWNVKRIRPTEMWPYDYSRENETPLLWVSEGFTNYYGNIGVYRAGIINKKAFLDRVGEAISGVESNEARAYISPAASSVSTWLGYDTPVAFGISYYTQGQNLGALLDLSIRHDTAGQASLDDVMRALYKEYYRQGKGFSTEDMIGIINRLTERDYHDFYRRYVWGIEVPPYDTIFGYAGYRVEKTAHKVPVMGIDGRGGAEGIRVTGIPPGSPAAGAGLVVGDVITKINGQEPRALPMNNLVGKMVKVTIKREGVNKEVLMKIGSRDEVGYNLVELPRPLADQLKVREGWLKVGQ